MGLNSRFLRVYIVPGAVFQSVMIGGGYGTGREIVEYFSKFGPVGGVLSFGIVFLCYSIVLSLTFELSRLYQAYDYRRFLMKLLGKNWIAVVYEILIVTVSLMSLAVLASASEHILADSFEMPAGLGRFLMLGIIGLLSYFGRDLIETVLTAWSVFLYVVIVVVFITVLTTESDAISSRFSAMEVAAGWQLSGFKYALFSLSVVPLLLYIARDFKNRSEAMYSGVFAAAIALIPGVIMHIVFMAAYPGIIKEPIPIYSLLSGIGATTLIFVYTIMLLGTFVETGAGMLQGFNERIDSFLIERRGVGLSRRMHAVIAVSAVSISGPLSWWGIVNLVAYGYGSMAWGFLAVYILPVVAIGTFKLVKTK